MRYDPGRDLGWLLLRPWVALPGASRGTSSADADEEEEELF